MKTRSKHSKLRFPSRHQSVSPAIKIERATVIGALQPIVRMLGGMLPTNIEVTLHDLTNPGHSVIAIANGHVTGRGIGGSALSGPKDDLSFAAIMTELSVRGRAVHAVCNDYPTQNSSGQQLRSSSVIFRDSEGEPFAALCLNADMSMFEAAHGLLERLLRKSAPAPTEPAQAAAPEMDELMKEIIQDAVDNLGKPVSRMSKDEKIHAVQAMMRRGLFIVRGGVGRAAAALGVTRHSIYNYLDELKERNGGVDPEPRTATPSKRA